MPSVQEVEEGVRFRNAEITATCELSLGSWGSAPGSLAYPVSVITSSATEARHSSLDGWGGEVEVTSRKRQRAGVRDAHESWVFP